MTPTEYLGWEENQPIKYEYINGKIYAMTGGTFPAPFLQSMKMLYFLKMEMKIRF